MDETSRMDRMRKCRNRRRARGVAPVIPSKVRQHGWHILKRYAQTIGLIVSHWLRFDTSMKMYTNIFCNYFSVRRPWFLTHEHVK